MGVLILLVVFAIPATGGWYITSLLCRSSRVRWYWAVVGTAGSALLTAGLFWLGLSLGRGDLGKGVRPWDIALLVFLFPAGCALIPAAMTYLYYRFCRSSTVSGGR
jgi:hypothetical protein